MTTVSEAFPSNYLKAADLNNRTVKVKKGLVLNKTNAVEIAATHGDQMENWTGKEIELFSTMVPFQGQNVLAIRVRAVAEAVAAVAADPNDPLGI